MTGGARTDVQITVDGQPLGLAPFVREMIATVVYAMVGNLKGVEQPRQLVLTITRADGGEG